MIHHFDNHGDYRGTSLGTKELVAILIAIPLLPLLLVLAILFYPLYVLWIYENRDRQMNKNFYTWYENRSGYIFSLGCWVLAFLVMILK